MKAEFCVGETYGDAEVAICFSIRRRVSFGGERNELTRLVNVWNCEKLFRPSLSSSLRFASETNTGEDASGKGREGGAFNASRSTLAVI